MRLPGSSSVKIWRGNADRLIKMQMLSIYLQARGKENPGMNLESLNLLAMKMRPITRNKLSPGGLDSGSLSFLITTCVLFYHNLLPPPPQKKKLNELDSPVGGMLAWCGFRSSASQKPGASHPSPRQVKVREFKVTLVYTVNLSHLRFI